MTMRPDSALASLLLTNRLVDVGVKPLTSGEYWQLVEQVPELAALLGAGVEDLTGEVGLARELAERVCRLLDAGTAFAVELERLEQQGLDVISPFDGAYPARLPLRLGATAPPILYAAGPTGLLAEPGIAVVGSRGVGDEGALVAQQAARLAAERGEVLISGGAKGVDQLAMDAAGDAGGPVVGVLADALVQRLRRPEVRRAVSAGRLCLLTPYKPTAGFSVASAMARNKIIYALARVTLVVTADAEQGGTWEGAVEALRRGFGQVAVWTGAGAGDGNPLLVHKGALPIEVVETLADIPEAARPDPQEQLRLIV